MTRIFTIWFLLLLTACGSGKTMTSGGSTSKTSYQQLVMNHLGSLPGYSRFEKSGLELKLISSKTDDRGMTHMRYQQQFRKLPLLYAELIVHVKDDAVYRVDGQLAELSVSSTTPDVSDEQAVSAAVAYKSISQPFSSHTRLLIIEMDRIYDHLAWEVIIKKGLMRYIFIVDANTGAVLKEIPGIHTLKKN